MTALPARGKRTARPLPLGVADAAVVGLTACNVGTGTSSIRAEFRKHDQTIQLDLAATAATQNTSGAVSASIGKAVGPAYRDNLIQYCNQSGHGSDKLESLQLEVGVR